MCSRYSLINLLAIVTLVMIHTGSSLAERVSLEGLQSGFAVDRMIGLAVLLAVAIVAQTVVVQLLRLYVRARYQGS